MKRDTKTEISLASAGESWYEARSVVEVIPDGEKGDLLYDRHPAGAEEKRTVKIPLRDFRTARTKRRRSGWLWDFLDEKTMVVKLTDQGFGELFPKNGRGGPSGGDIMSLILCGDRNR